MTEAPDPITLATNTPDRWRTNLLVAATTLQSVVAATYCFGLFQAVRDYLADQDLRAITRPFFLLFTPACVTLASLVLVAGAAMALRTRKTPDRSRRALLLAFGVALPLQVLPNLVPMSWSYTFPENMREQGLALLQKFGPPSALGGLIDVLPLVLSITVGLSRAGLRNLRIRPDQPIGAIIAFAASVQLALLATAALAFVEPIVPQRWVSVGLLLVALHYGTAATACFLLARSGQQRRKLQAIPAISAFCLLLPGAIELLAGLSSTQVWDHYLFAWGDRAGIVSPHDLPQHVLLFVTRSMLTALAANDLLARSSA